MPLLFVPSVRSQEVGVTSQAPSPQGEQALLNNHYPSPTLEETAGPMFSKLNLGAKLLFPNRVSYVYFKVFFNFYE